MKVKYTVILTLLTLFVTIGTYAQKSTIQKDRLPKEAQTFINTNFSKQELSYIIMDIDDGKTEYDVLFTNGLEVEFDASGNWKKVKGKYETIPTGFIPNKITSYINTNFPGTSIYKIEKNPFKYEVKLSTGLELDFNTSGDFVRIDD